MEKNPRNSSFPENKKKVVKNSRGFFLLVNSEEKNKNVKLQKAKKGRKYGKNPRNNFFPENNKGGEKFPWVFSSSKQCRK
jgi:hypothetical protein